MYYLVIVSAKRSTHASKHKASAGYYREREAEKPSAVKTTAKTLTVRKWQMMRL